MRRGPGNELSLCLRALALAAIASLAACGGNAYNTTGPPVQPSATSGSAILYPQTPSVPVGSTIQFLADVPGHTSETFTWSVKGGGTISSSGVYTAGATPGTATVTAKAGSFTGTSIVTVTSAVPNGIVISPAAFYVAAGSTVPISVLNSGGTAATVTEWDVNGAANGDTLHGTIDNSGNYTAPLTPPPGGTTTITAHTATGSANAVVTVVFSNASLAGPYAFSYTGQDSKGPLGFIGSFTAGGSTGTISNLVEDAAAADVGPKTITVTGTFTVGPDGTTQATLSDGTTWQFVLNGNSAPFAGKPAQQALLVRFDKFATGSGTINQQDPTAVNLPMPEGPYAFDLSEMTTFSKIFVAAGKFQSTGLIGTSGALTPGVWDSNLAGSVSSDDTSLTGSFTTDASNSGSGRGTMTLTSTRTTIDKATSWQFAFYVVDATHLKLLETDGVLLAAGDIYNAPNTNGLFSTASLATGSYAFTTSGQSSVSGPFSQGGVFDSNGAGQINGGAMDVNPGVGSITLDDTVSTTTYTVDPSLGRVQFVITAQQNSKDAGTWNFAGYQTLNNGMLMVETDTINVQTVVLGTAYRQSGPNNLQGSYAANFKSFNSTTEQDTIGQFSIANTLISTGALSDNVQPGSTSPGIPITQSIVGAPGAFGRGTMTIYTQNQTFPLAFYVVDQNTALVLETDGARNLTGILIKQF
jgi:hypothetical protein